MDEKKDLKRDETIELEQKKQNDQSVDIEPSNLIGVQQLTPRRKPLSSVAIISLLFSLLTVIGMYLYFTLNYVSPINTALRIGDIHIDNQTFDQVKAYIVETNQNSEEEVDDNFVSIYLADTAILSEKAKELGLSVTEEDYQDLADGYGKMAERVALRIKLEEFLKEEAEISEEEMKAFYEELKDDYYVVDSTFDFYAIQSDTPIPENYTFENSELTLQKGTLKQLRLYGISHPKKGVFLIESEDENDKSYKYIVIVNGELQYIPFDQVKDKIEEALYIQKTDGRILDYLQEGRVVYDIRYFR